MTNQEFFLAISNKHHIIFDFDATLATLDIDWSGWYPGIQEIFVKYDPDFQRGNIRGNAFNNLKNRYKKRYGAQLNTELLEFQREFERSNYIGYTKHNKSINILEKLVTSGWKASLWTSNCLETIAEPMEEMRINNVFEYIVTRDDVTYEKPDAEGFNKIINQDNHQLDEFLMIGDSTTDKEAAQNSGISFLHVSEISDHLPPGWDR